MSVAKWIVVPMLALCGCSSGSGGGASSDRTHDPVLLFDRLQLTGDYYAEGACVGDFDRDGTPDVASGPLWYEGPDFTTAHSFFAPQVFSTLSYADVFLMFAEDFDNDGWDDILTIGLPGSSAYWYENDGGAGGPWTRHLVWQTVDTESPTLVDLDADGQSELLCASGGFLTYFERDPSDPTMPWTAHQISPLRIFGQFTHGLGAGDVDGDGRPDVLTGAGWFQQPQSLAGDPAWPHRAFQFTASGGAQIHVFDVDGDGDGDIVSSMNAHGFGLSWFEQVQDVSGITFDEHVILPTDPLPGDPGQFSQLHALTVADLNGDGLTDIVTGKTWLAHNGSDPGAAEPAVLFVFHLERNGGARFVPVCIDGDSGVGRQVVAHDLDGDGKVDIVAGNKKGAFVFRNR